MSHGRERVNNELQENCANQLTLAFIVEAKVELILL